jgi:hypothetical protein
MQRGEYLTLSQKHQRPLKPSSTQEGVARQCTDQIAMSDRSHLITQAHGDHLEGPNAFTSPAGCQAFWELFESRTGGGVSADYNHLLCPPGSPHFGGVTFTDEVPPQCPMQETQHTPWYADPGDVPTPVRGPLEYTYIKARQTYPYLSFFVNEKLVPRVLTGRVKGTVAGNPGG